MSFLRVDNLGIILATGGFFSVDLSQSGGGGGGGTITPSGQITFAGRGIYNASGQQVVLRGPELTYPNSGITELDEIASWGANAIRVLIGLDTANGVTPAALDAFFARLVHHNMMAWVSFYTWNDGANNEINAPLGGGNFFQLTAPPGTGVCSVDSHSPCYLSVWDRQWAKDLMATYKANVIIDAMQEYKVSSALQNSPDSVKRAAWRDASIAAIQFFRAAGYQNPLAIMSNFEGRDLKAILDHAPAILAADTVKVGGQSQVIFGWQAYWSDAGNPNFYPNWQGGDILGVGQSLTATQAINTILPTLGYPIQCGFDAYAADTNGDFPQQIAAAADQNNSWLWWDYRNGVLDMQGWSSQRQAVVDAPDGFGGARTALSGGGSGVTLTPLPLNLRLAITGHSIWDNITKGPLQEGVAAMGGTASVRASTGPYANAQIRWTDRFVAPDEIRGLLETSGPDGFDVFCGIEAHGGDYGGRASVAGHIEWSDAYGYATLWHNLGASAGCDYSYYANFWRNDPPRVFDSAWRAAQELEKPLWTDIINQVNTRKAAGTPPMRVIPWLEVFCGVYDAIQAGTVTGITMASIFSDDVHPATAVGRWLQIATLLLVVYHRHTETIPANLGSTANISPALAAQLRPIVWTACINDARTGLPAGLN